MHLRFIGITVLCSLCMCACGPKLADKDIVGTWKVDPATAGADPAESKTTFTFTGDHAYVMSTPMRIDVKGTWGFYQQKCTLSPTTVSIGSPVDPNKTIDMSITDFLQRAQSLGNPQAYQQMKGIADTVVLTVSSDGKKMTQSGKPALVKSS